MDSIFEVFGAFSFVIGIFAVLNFWNNRVYTFSAFKAHLLASAVGIISATILMGIIYLFSGEFESKEALIICGIVGTII